MSERRQLTQHEQDVFARYREVKALGISFDEHKIALDLWERGKIGFTEPYPVEMFNYYAFIATLKRGLRYYLDAMTTTQPKWLADVKQKIASSLPSTLPDGRTEFIASTMSEPKVSGKFRKYAFTCETKDKRIINMSVSPTLLERILAIVEQGKNFAITKQGIGINTDYIVEAY